MRDLFYEDINFQTLSDKKIPKKEKSIELFNIILLKYNHFVKVASLNFKVRIEKLKKKNSNLCFLFL